MGASVLANVAFTSRLFGVYYFLCVCVREKFTLEQDIGDTEEAIRQKSAEVQVRLAGHQQPQRGLNPELTLH